MLQGMGGDWVVDSPHPCLCPCNETEVTKCTRSICNVEATDIVKVWENKLSTHPTVDVRLRDAHSDQVCAAQHKALRYGYWSPPQCVGIGLTPCCSIATPSGGVAIQSHGQCTWARVCSLASAWVVDSRLHCSLIPTSSVTFSHLRTCIPNRQ